MLEPPSRRSWPRFRNLWPDVYDALQRGYAIRDVHSALVKDGQWTSGYDTFRRHVARARRELPTPTPSPQRRRAAEAPPPRHPPPDRHNKRAAVQRNTLDEPTERDPYDYQSGMSPEAQDLI